MNQEGDYQGAKRALLISISNYDKLEPLDFCEKDGNMMYEVLSQLEYDIPIKNRLIGGRVEYQRLRDTILDFFSDHTIHPKDTLLFYFSGHGVLGDDGEHYLSTSEIDPDKPRKRGFSFDELSKFREDCNSKTIFTILDCCYSGADKPGSKGSEDKANDAKALLKIKSNIPGEGKCILTACKPMQKAYEYKEQGHSFFTFYLAEALTSYDCADEGGNVTPYKLNEYIDNRIRSLPPETRPKQTPLLNCLTAGKIILARLKPKTSVEKRSEADTAIFEALKCMEAKDYTNALSSLDKAIKIDTKNAEAYFYQGNTFAKLANYQEATKSYQKALEIDPNPKYASAASRLLELVATYIEKKEKRDEPEATDIQKKIQKNVDSATKKANKNEKFYTVLEPTPNKNEKFYALPEPTGTAPYHLDLSRIIPVDKIVKSGSIAFHIVGDTGGRITKSLMATQLVELAMKSDFDRMNPSKNPSFLYLLGDIVFGGACYYYSRFYVPYAHYPAPIFAIPGNLDGDRSSGSNEKSLAGFVTNFCAEKQELTADAKDIKRWPMIQPNVYWTLEAPFVTIIGLYSNVPAGGVIKQDQYEWFEKELRTAPKEKALIVSVHHPPFSVDEEQSGSDTILKVLDNAFKQSGRLPDIVFSGHLHNYQRFTRDLVHEKKKYQIPYVVVGTGGGGKLHYMQRHRNGEQIGVPFKLPDRKDVVLEKYCDYRHGFLRLQMTADTLKGKFYSITSKHSTVHTEKIDDFGLDLHKHKIV